MPLLSLCSSSIHNEYIISILALMELLMLRAQCRVLRVDAGIGSRFVYGSFQYRPRRESIKIQGYVSFG